MRHLTSLIAVITLISAAVWAVASNLENGALVLVDDLNHILPPNVYQGETCTVDVKTKSEKGARAFSVGLSFSDGEAAEDFEVREGLASPQVLHYSHDNSKEHFIRLVIGDGLGSEKNLTVIRSRGQVAAVAVKEKVCFLSN